ncbi:MAG: hypothetical protein JST54_08180 [Deltaproteobacteria bacterium]|nr:hypothetical protein [Deltaproteobacteria bacterium]
MSAFPRDLLSRARPRDPHERIRPRGQETAIALGTTLAAVGLGLLAAFAPLPTHHSLELRAGLGLLAFMALRVLAMRARRSGGWPPELEEAVGLLRAGDRHAAAAQLEVLLHDARVHPAYRAVGLAWSGLVALRGGELGRAQDLWAEVARSGHWKERGLRFALSGLPGLCALAAAAEGDLDRARRWLRDAPRIDEELSAGPRTLAAIYIALRGGDREAARRFAVAGWALAEATLAPAELRGMRVLAALAEEDPQSLDARRWRAGARPGWPGELDFLAATWPELSIYLRDHGFSPSAGALHG